MVLIVILSRGQCRSHSLSVVWVADGGYMGWADIEHIARETLERGLPESDCVEYKRSDTFAAKSVALTQLTR